MNNFNFEKIISALREIKLTPGERSSMRLRVSQHMHRHPIGSRVSLFTFRYMVTASLALVLILGTGGAVAFASQSSLPGQKLYGVKRATEQVKKIALRTTEAKADYELALIDKRFTETNELITEQKLTTENESVVIAAIKEHTDDFKAETSELSTNDPALALSYNVKLGNTLKTGTHILLALSDRQSKSSLSPNTLVLAAYATAEKVSAEKKQLESLIVSDTNIATIKTAEKRYTETLAMLTEKSIHPTVTTTITPSDTKIETGTVTASTVALKTATPTLVTTTAKEISTDTDTKTDLQSLADALQVAYDAKKYSQVIIICDQIEQKLHEEQKIKEVEETYNIDISSDTGAKTEVKSQTVVSEKLELLPEIPTTTTTTSTVGQ